MKERLDLAIRCNALSEDEVNQLCREQGIYNHHIQLWVKAFSDESMTSNQSTNADENKQLKAENKSLKKELRRK